MNTDLSDNLLISALDAPLYPGRRVVDLREMGISECPTLGVTCYSKACPAVPLHVHPDTIEICYLASGEHINQCGDQVWRLRGGDLWVNRPDTPHSSGIHPTGPSTLYWLLFTRPEPGQSLAGLSPERSQEFWKVWEGFSGRAYYAGSGIRSYFEHLLQLSASPQLTWHETRLRIAVNAFFFAALSVVESENRIPVHSGIARVLTRLTQSSPEELPDLPELAAHARLSLSHFKATFRDCVGIPPGQYLLRRRLTAAAQRLADTTENITQIAYRYGFSSSQHFATMFKTYLGLTPAAYRREKKGKGERLRSEAAGQGSTP